MDEVRHKDLAMQSEISATSTNRANMNRVGIDVRSREAFELLKLGEAICNLQVDQRKMRLNAEDMRFERDRYKASAAEFQKKLSAALDENARLRDLREVLKIMSQEKEVAFQGMQARETAALAHAEDLRRNNADLPVILAAIEEQLEQAQRELDDTKASMEDMRLAFIELTRNLIAEAASAQDVIARSSRTGTDGSK